MAQGEAVWPAWWRALTEFGYFVGLVPVIGGTLVCLTVLRPALADPRASVTPAEAARVRARAARLLAHGGPLLLVAAYGQIAARVARTGGGTTFAAGLSPIRIARFFVSPGKAGDWVSTGTVFLVQNLMLVAGALLLASLYARGAAGRLDRVAAWVASLVAVGSLVNGLPSRPKPLGDLVDPLLDHAHIIGSSAWVGGLVGMVLLAGRRRGLVDSERGGLFWAVVWQRFSMHAMVAVGIVVASGAWLTWHYVGTLGALSTTFFGRVLLAKLVLVLVMLGLGGCNQFVLTPRAARAHATGDPRGGFALTVRHLPAVVTVEAILGGSVLAIVPFLAGGSAREQAGIGAARPVDAGLLALALLLAFCLAGSLYTAHRVGRLLVHRAGEPLRQPAR
jgi:copper transport protein